MPSCKCHYGTYILARYKNDTGDMQLGARKEILGLTRLHTDA